MAGRPRHPTKEFEHLLDGAEDQGWTVERGAKYFKMKCPCEAKHMKWMHITPSDPNYLLNLRKKLARDTCWEDL